MTAPTPTPAAPAGSTAAELPPRDPRDAIAGVQAHPATVEQGLSR